MPPRTETLAGTRWLELRNVYHTGPNGTEKAWTYATRPHGTGAVCVIATTADPEPALVVVRQRRHPVGRHVLEFPAGLIDPGESLATTALRELREETGWEAEILGVSPATYPSPGLTDETIYFARARLTHRGTATPEEDEEIETFLWPLTEVCARLEAAAAEGDGIDSKLWNYALAHAQR